VAVTGLKQGVLSEQTRIREGFIIIKVNNNKVTTVEGLKTSLAKRRQLGHYQWHLSGPAAKRISVRTERPAISRKRF
jgi:hypothetical protein